MLYFWGFRLHMEVLTLSNVLHRVYVCSVSVSVCVCMLTEIKDESERQ